jgi:hypothetical protein
MTRDLERNTHLPPEHPANLDRLGTSPDLTFPEHLRTSHLRLPLVAPCGIGQICKSPRTGTVHDNGFSYRCHSSPNAVDSPPGPGSRHPAWQLARVQERCRTRADGMEIFPWYRRRGRVGVAAPVAGSQSTVLAHGRLPRPVAPAPT